MVLSGNSLWWQVRYEGEDKSIMVGHKDAEQDPIEDPELKTINWDNTSLNYPLNKSIGGSFPHGGYGVFRKNEAIGQGGYWIFDEDHPILKGTGLSKCDQIMFFKLKEYDGMPIVGVDNEGFPVPDLKKIDAYAFNFLGFDWGYRLGHTSGTMHVMRTKKDSGFLFHLGAKDFSSTFRVTNKPEYKKSVEMMKKIFTNVVNYSVNGEDIVLIDVPRRDVAKAFTTPYMQNLSLDAINFPCEPGIVN
jgi:hypothetical protein